MLDVQIFGMNPRGHHVVSVGLHALNVGLLCWTLWRLTAALWPSVLAALLFSLHPFRVESVAWVAERKDLLAGWFWISTVAAYTSYLRRHGPGRYALLLGLYALGLMAKPMLVSLPLVLLLLDFWPLGRFVGTTRRPHSPAGALPGIIREKIPLLLLAAASCVVTYSAQQRGGAVNLFVPLGERLSNAAVAVVTYVAKTVWPVRLAVFYPHPETSLSVVYIATAMLAIAVASVLALAAWRRQPAVTVGWLWFAGSLVPVLGIVQVGAQSYADRYTYLPSIGLSIAVAWGAFAPAFRLRRRAAVLAAGAAVAIIVSFAAASRVQLRHWRGDLALFSHGIAVTRGNWLLEHNLGVHLLAQGNTAEALGHFRESQRIKPAYSRSAFGLALASERLGQTEEAMRWYREAMGRSPLLAEAAYNLGLMYVARRNYPEAISLFRRALEIDPESVTARNNLGLTLLESGRPGEALTEISAVVRARPQDPAYRSNLGVVLERLGRPAEARAQHEEARRLKAGQAPARGSRP
jgi:Flp pilus assembly protein TadD